MAGKVVSEVTLKLKSEGLDSAVKGSKAVADFFASAAESAKQTANASKQIKSPTASGSGGSRAMSSSEAALESGSYGVARSAVGTGAASRDFAQQAQGLGGLVRLYATFAANIFAVGAAFTALSKAADLQNMIRGLDQLGATSGRALGGLAKQVEVASDGMLSLRDSIQTVAQASAAGISSKQILQITEVAKKASIALGRDMGDSITRLTKGISKLEPELLDELGIMTRVDKATQDYARTVGKTTAELTQFEKQQAFANAVLKEGLDKFNSIDISGNPYQKLLASFQNLATSGLALINKVLGPIANYLAESPTALSAALAYIATILVKQAIPALGAFREASEKALERTQELQKRRVSDTQATVAKIAKIEQDGVKARLAAQLKEADEAANIAAERAGTLEEQFKKSLSGSKKTGSSQILKDISNTSLEDITDKQLKRLEDLGKKQSKASQGYTDLAASIRVAQAAQKDFFEIEAKIDKLRDPEERAKAEAAASKKILDGNAQYQRNLQMVTDGERKLALQTAATTAVQETQQLGAKFALSNYFNSLKQIESSGFTQKLSKGWEALTTTIKVSALSVTNFANKLNTVLFVVGTIVTVFEILDAVFSKATKELNNFNTAVDVLEASIDGASKTLNEFYSGRNVSAAKVVSGITAISNAFNDLSDSAGSAIDSLKVLQREMNGWDKGIDFVKSIFGKGTAKLETDLAKSIKKALELASASGIDTNLQGKLQDATGLAGSSFEKIKANLSGLPTDKLEKIRDILDDANKKIRENEQRFVGLNGRIDQAAKHLQEFSNSLLPSDIVGKLGNDVLGIGVQLEKLMVAPVDQAVAKLADMSKDANQLIGLDPGDAKALVQYSKSLNDLTEGRAALLKAGKDQDDKITKSTKELVEEQRQLGENRNEGFIKLIQQELDDLKQGKALINQSLEATNDKLGTAQNDFLGKFSTLVPNALAKGATLIANSIGVAFERAKLALAKAELQGPSGVGDAKRAADLAIRELELQQKQIDVQLELIDSNSKLADAITKSSAQRDLEKAAPGSQAATNAQTTIDKLNAKEALRNKSAAELAKIVADTNAGLTQQLAAADALQDAQKKEALNAQSVNLTAQKRSEEIKKQQGSLAELATREERIAQLNLQIKTSTQERNSILSSAVGYITEQAAELQKLYDLQALNVRQSKELRDIDLAIAQLRVVSQDEVTRGKIRDLEVQRGKLQIAQAQELENVQLRGNLAVAAATASRQLRELEFISKITNLQSDSISIRLNAEESILTVLKQANQISDEYLANKQAEIALQKLQVEYATRYRDIDLQHAQATAGLADKRQALQSAAPSVANSAALAELNKQEKQANDIRAESVKNLDSYFDNTKKVIGITKDSAIETAKYNKVLEETQTIAEALADVFGDLGKSIGDGLEKGLTSFKKFQDKQARINKDYADDKEKRDKESAKNQLDLYADEAGAAKQLFGEKTALYKTFAALEKAMHLARLAMYVADTVASLQASAARTGATVVEAGVDAVAGVVKAIASMPFPANIVAGAVTAAAMAALLSSIGGSGPQVNTTGQSAADVQKVQGTGSKYDKDGRIVETGKGVFGDSSAKSNSIANSLEIIKDTSVEGIATDNKMLDVLESIDNNTKTASIALYKETGLRTGTAFGNLGTGQTILSKTGANSIGDAIKTGLVNMFTGIGGLDLDRVKKAFGFSKTVTAEVIDSGIKIKGSFLDLMNGLSGAIVGYETDLVTTTKKSFFGLSKSTSTEIQTQIASLGSDITDSISAIFANAGQLFVSVGASIGLTEAQVSDKLAQIPVDAIASLKDLKGEDLEKEFSAVINGILDDAADSLFAGMKKYQKFGEGMLETVIRVVDDNNKIKASFESIGKTYTNLSFDVSEALVNSAGSLKDFLDIVSNYKDTFLSDAEKLAPIRNNVSSTLNSLSTSIKTLTGQSVPQTREQFKAIINALDITTESGRTLFAQLMGISDAFATVTEEHQQLIEEYSSLEDKLLDTFRDNAKIREAIDFKATKNMDAVTKAQYEQNRSIEKQISALQEYYDLMDQLDDATLTTVQLKEKERKAVNDSNLALYDYVNAVKDLKTATEDAANQLNTINSEMNNLASTAAQTSAALESAAQNIVNGYSGAQSNLDSSKTALQNALLAISQGYTNAASAVAAAQEQVGAVSKQAVKNLQNFSKSIKEFIRATSSSELGLAGGPSRVKLLQAQFNDLMNKALLGDTDAQGQLTGVAQELLSAGKEQSTSALEYSKLYGQVIGTLDQLSKTIDQQVGIGDDLADQANNAAAGLAAANAELAKWTQLLKDSGADPNAVGDPVEAARKAYEDASKAVVSATKDVETWNKLIAKYGFDTQANTKSSADTITKYFDDWTKAKADNDTAQDNLQKGLALLNTNGITWNKNNTDALKTLKDTIDAYNKDQATIVKSNAIIAATKLDDIKDAINDMADSLYAAIVGTPNVKIPEAGMGQVPSAQTASVDSIVKATDSGSAAMATAANDDSTYAGRYKMINGQLHDVVNGSDIAQFDEGTMYAPKDGLAFIHEGEKITPAKYNGSIDEQLLNEVINLRNEVRMLREVNSLTEVNTRKTKDMFSNVTLGGTVMQTQVAA